MGRRDATPLSAGFYPPGVVGGVEMRDVDLRGRGLTPKYVIVNDQVAFHNAVGVLQSACSYGRGGMMLVRGCGEADDG